MKTFNNGACSDIVSDGLLYSAESPQNTSLIQKQEKGLSSNYVILMKGGSP